MALNAATIIYAGLINDSAAIETAIETSTYDANQRFVVIPQDCNSCIILHVVSA